MATENDKEQSPLIDAVLENDKDAVKSLVENGADLNAQDPYGQTALMLAVLRGDNDDIVKYLVEKGADVNAKDEDGQTALMLAVEKNNGDIVKHLVEKGADVNAKNEDGYTALMLTVEKNNGDIVKDLVEHGADVNAKDSYGQTALMYAVVGENNEDVVKYLVERGADINAKSNAGHTALMVAAVKNEKDTFEYLVEHGADLEAKDNEGMGITRYYSNDLAREYRKQQREAYAGDAWNDIRQHMTASIYDEGATYAGYTTEGGDISVGKLRRRKPDELMGRKAPDGKSVDGNLYSIHNAFDHMMTFVHEGNHRLNGVLDGMHDGNFTAEQNVKLNYCTEAIAHTSECLAAALQYQRMKETGIEIYQYRDREGNLQNIPLEKVLDEYPRELQKYVTENGFDPRNKKDVEAVTEIGLQYWEECQDFYAYEEGQFDASAVSQGTREGVSQKEFDALINRMCDGVVIGDGVELDLRQFANRFNGMTDEEAQKHVARRNGKAVHKVEKSVENSEKEVLRDEMRGQTGEEVVLEPSDRAKQMRFDMRVDNKNLGQGNAIEGQGAVVPTKKQEKPLDLAIMNAANRGRD